MVPVCPQDWLIRCLSSGKMSPSMDWRFCHKHAFSSRQTSSSGQMSPSMDWRFCHEHAFSSHHLLGRCHLQWTEDFVTSMLFHYIVFREDVTFNVLKIRSQACFFITSDIIFRADVTFSGLKMIRSQACFFITSDISRVHRKRMNCKYQY